VALLQSVQQITYQTRLKSGGLAILNLWVSPENLTAPPDFYNRAFAAIAIQPDQKSVLESIV
jgi:hypothetical protein